MSGAEVAAIALGTAVAKAACGVWLGDHKLAATLGGDVIDAVSKKLTSARAERHFRRVWDQAAELVAERVEPLVEREYADLPENERIAALDAVRDTFERAALTEADLFAQDLDAVFLHRHLQGQDPERTRRAGLSAGGSALYELLLRECCAYTIEVARTLPQAGMNGVAELLRRDRQILDDLRTVLERLPARRGVGDFERDYLQLVANRLDRVELFGATLSQASRRYPLSVAYLNLMVAGEFSLNRPETPMNSAITEATASAARVDEVLASTRRLFIRGQAGLGKTTLLQWVAVHSARGSFTGPLTEWNGMVPFFVPLRRYAAGELPAPESFLAEVGRCRRSRISPAVTAWGLA